MRRTWKEVLEIIRRAYEADRVKVAAKDLLKPVRSALKEK